MRICMVVNTMNEFGGLEEFTKNLAIGVQRRGHSISVVSTVWVPANNQYLCDLREHNVSVVYLPKWQSIPISAWPTKKKIISIAMWLSTPLIYCLSLLLYLFRNKSWERSITSARNWQREQFVNRFEPNQRQPFVRLLLNWLRFRWRPDLIHIQGYTSDLLYIIDWAFKKKIPVIYEEHQTPDAQFDWWKDFSKSINKVSTVIAVSEISAQALREVCGVTKPIEVVYYMVSDPVEEGWVAGDGNNGSKPIMVTTNARLGVTKGLTYLLEAIMRVKTVYPSTQFRVYGSGPLRGELLGYAEQLGLDGNQIFVGSYTSRDELNRIMAQTDIYVMSSVLEGLPIALLEAMSYGRPVVVTSVGGIPDAIEDGVNGLLCMPNDPDGLAQRICSLIENPVLRIRLGNEARRSYEQGPYHSNFVCNRYISIYKKVLAQQSHHRSN